jgi:hypothetical protein
MWDAFREHFGKIDSDVLVWKADTRTMNPTVDDAFIARAYHEDESRASAEYGADFRRDIESYIDRELLDAVTMDGRRELPYLSTLTYTAFVDPSGGSVDSMTLGIAHREADGRSVLDVLREVKPPFSPEATVADFGAVLRQYHIREVNGDRYGGEWPREQFRKCGIDYRPSEQTRSDLYRELLPLLTSRRVELLDSLRLRAQLASLERRTARAGRDSIDHSPGSHDDLANAAAGALVLAAATDHRQGEMVEVEGL